ncbi:MAG: hypothetical protein WCF81_03280, partial [Roseiarcus sp.]
MSRLIIGKIIHGTLNLIQSYNPVTILITGGVEATANLADAIDGNGTTSYAIVNSGTISSKSGYATDLSGPNSYFINYGSISGAGGLLLTDDASVTNTATGRITASGTLPSPLSSISGIYITGPSGAGMAAISVTNAGVVTAADGYGIGLGASGSVSNSGTVTGGEDGIAVLAGAGNIQNSGSVTATLDDGVGLFQGGTVTNALGGSISGVVGATAAGIFITGAAGTITNGGQVNGSDYGVLVAAGGTVTNSASGTINGQGSGVSLSHGGTLSNSGAISSTAVNSAAADLELGGTLNNYAGGSISGAGYGAFLTGAPGTIMNAGTMTGAA